MRDAMDSRGRSPLAQAFSSFSAAIVAVGAVSGVLNVLALSGSFFMLLVYDRVIPGHSIPTLVGLVCLVGVAYFFQALLDFIRSRLLLEIGAAFDASLSARIYRAVAESVIKRPIVGAPLQPFHDLDQLRSFLSGPGPAALLDLPWIGLYLAICFLFHWLIGLTATLGACLLVGITLWTDLLTRRPVAMATKLSAQRQQLALASVQNAETLHALGMHGAIQERWCSASSAYLAQQKKAANVTGSLASFARVFRMFLQSGVLAVGAYLVVEQKATGGIIIASSILTARALAPVEQAIANWRGFVASRQAWSRLKALLTDQAGCVPLLLPPPAKMLQLEHVFAGAPGSSRMIVQDVTFRLQAGAGLGIIGPSGCGKSALARTLVGIWAPAKGEVRLDGAALNQWSSTALGGHVGYLPQTVELLAGTVAENISRFAPAVGDDEVVKAAKAADVHELVLRLPGGYETPIGQGGAELSAGQRQRIALARALFREPFFVVLDEPNSNLDAEGEAALTRAVTRCRLRGAIVVMVAHRPSALEPLDTILLMDEGRVQAFGPKAEILEQVIAKPKAPEPAALTSAPVVDAVQDPLDAG